MIKMKKIFIKILFLVALNIQNSFANITIEEAIDSAYQNNIELKSQEYSYKTAKSEKLKSLGGFLPNIEANINSGSRKTRIGDNTEIKDDIDKKSLTASQNLFNGFGSVNELKKANNILKREKAIKDSKIQQITLNVVRSYLDILKYQKLLQISENNQLAQEKLLDYIQRKFELQDSTKSEFARAKADYVKAKNNQIFTQNNLNLSKANFTSHTGLDLNSAETLEEITETEIKIEENIDQLFQKALENNPEIKAANYSFMASKYDANVARSTLSPKVSLNFNMSEEQNSLYLDDQKEKGASVYLNVNIPIFNSGQSYFAISATNNNKQKESYNLEATKQKIQNSIIEYTNKQENYQANYISSKELEKANEIYVETLIQEEKLGTKSIIELLEAQQNLYTSQIEVVNLFYEKIYAGFEIKALIGELYQTNLK